MNNDHIGFCNGCGQTVQIVQGWSTRDKKYCYSCNLERSRKKKIEESLVRGVRVYKPTKRLKEKRDEDKVLNEKLWKMRRHHCVECNIDLGVKPQKFMFSHLLSKGAHPELRHEPSNIVFHCYDCHQKWEFGDRAGMKTLRLNIDWMRENGYTK